jgi:hypothetical protein
MKNIQLLLIVVVLGFSLPSFGADSNWVAKFLSRYRPTANPLAASPVPQVNSALFQGNSVAVTLNDVIRLMLANNLNISVDRLPPQITQF